MIKKQFYYAVFSKISITHRVWVIWVFIVPSQVQDHLELEFSDSQMDSLSAATLALLELRNFEPLQAMPPILKYRSLIGFLQSGSYFICNLIHGHPKKPNTVINLFCNMTPAEMTYVIWPLIYICWDLNLEVVSLKLLLFLRISAGGRQAQLRLKCSRPLQIH